MDSDDNKDPWFQASPKQDCDYTVRWKTAKVFIYTYIPAQINREMQAVQHDIVRERRQMQAV